METGPRLIHRSVCRLPYRRMMRFARERYPTFETARQAADSIDDQAYIKEARFGLELFWTAPWLPCMKRIERRTCCGDKSAAKR